MQTFQDFTKAVSEGHVTEFLVKAIKEHMSSEDYKLAVIADEYDRQRNTTINTYVKKLYSADGREYVDFTASNNRIASNFFRRFNVQRCTYSLGNGVTFNTDGIKEKLGERFDNDLYRCGYKALIHGKTYGFWNVDRLYNFPLTEFVPLLDEEDGTLRAGIRFWSMDWTKRPVSVVLYEEDGYTKYRTKEGYKGLDLTMIEDKRRYVQIIAHTEAAGDVLAGEENYGSLPIVPLYGSSLKQSTIVGMRAGIDAFDLVSSGFANDLQDCAVIYWKIGNALGMTDADVQQFLDRMKLQHVAIVDTENSSADPYTQEIPYNAQEAFLNRITQSLYRDFGAFNTEDVAAGNITATQILAAYEPMDEAADDFEYQIIEFVQQILSLMGLEGVPQFKRNRISNQTEQVNMVIAEAQYLDDETVLSLLPNITPDMIPEILARRDAQDTARWTEEGAALQQDQNGGFRYVE